MLPDLKSPLRPLIYLITSGETTNRTTPATEDFSNILRLVESAVAAHIDLIQIREKNLSAKVLYQLAVSAASITKESATKLLINDRSDIAATAGADGVHLTTSSLPAKVVRNSFGNKFLIGVSTHSREEAGLACDDGADFVVFGPVFETDSKKDYGEPAGLIGLSNVCSQVSPLPVFALGGVTVENASECFCAGARGVAAIRMLQQAERIADIAGEIRRRFARERSSKGDPLINTN